MAWNQEYELERRTFKKVIRIKSHQRYKFELFDRWPFQSRQCIKHNQNKKRKRKPATFRKQVAQGKPEEWNCVPHDHAFGCIPRSKEELYIFPDGRIKEI